MSLCAIIPVEYLLAANQSLEAQGFGPNNFSVPAYSEGGASHAALHAWHNPEFEAAVLALPHVVAEISDGDPIARTLALIETQGAWWGAQVPSLPDTGTLEPGAMYHYGDTLYLVLVAHSRDQWGGDPEQWPTYIRRIRKPGEVREWEPVRDRYDAYWLINPFTGLPDQCTYGGYTWTVTGGNAAGTNTWEPGVFGWTSDAPVAEWPEFVQPMAGDPPYMMGSKVTFQGKHYVSKINNNVWSPTAYPAGWEQQP